jgi:hypothetical protein
MARSPPKSRFIRTAPKTRTDATTRFTKATEKLHRTVDRAFNQEPDAQRSPFNERERYVAALFAVAQYFTSLVGRPIGDRFFEIASAIADLNVGTVHPLLKPERADHRRADPSQFWRARARVALGLEALLRSGLDRDDAIAKIASQYSSITDLEGVRRDRSKLGPIVFGWRREFRANRVKNFEAKELFVEGMKRIDQLSSPRDCGRFALSQFAEADESARVSSPSS